MTRLIAGQHRGQRLDTLSGDRTRPTSERVREAVFAAIVSWGGDPSAERQLAGLSFLDCYAGSGAMALEACSRGAAPVWCVESHPKALQVVRRNVQRLGADVHVCAGTVETVVGAQAPQPFDVVWLDPPYSVDTDALDAVVERILEGGWLCTDGLLVLERSARDRPPKRMVGDGAWRKKYGDTTVYFGSDI